MKKFLLIYKRSAYETYFSDQRNFPKHLRIPLKEMERFKETHQRHYRALAAVEKALRANGVIYKKIRRGRKVDFSRFDFVITVGGDGTFLEAASRLTRQLILGINSDPVWSVGQFCLTGRQNYDKVIKSLLTERYHVKSVNRLWMTIKGQRIGLNVLNDILVCHENPAAMSRYYLIVNGKKEEHRSSGVWVATAAGSTGAICSAGGNILPSNSRRLQYMVRELYDGPGPRHRLRSGLVKAGGTLKMMSLMKDGVIFVDGAHVRYPFHFGEQLIVRNSPQALRVVVI